MQTKQKSLQTKSVTTIKTANLLMRLLLKSQSQLGQLGQNLLEKGFMFQNQKLHHLKSQMNLQKKNLSKI